MDYSFQDMDLWIEVARAWVRIEGAIPGSLIALMEQLTAGDLRMQIYIHHRILKYPLLRRAFVEFQNRECEDAADDIPGDPLDQPRIQPVTIPGPVFSVHERMFH